MKFRLAYSWKKFTVFALFYFVFEGNFQVQPPPRGGGFYMEGLFSEFYGSSYTASTATLGRISSEETGTFSHHPPLARTHFIASRTSLPSLSVSKWHEREGFFAGLLCCFYLLVSFSQLFFTSLYRRNHHEQTTLWSFPVERGSQWN